MNLLEKKMVDLLKDLKENYGALYIKTEFEAEGTHIEEILRPKDVILVKGSRGMKMEEIVNSLEERSSI